MGSSGAAVVFAGGTVMVATASLALTGLGVLTSIGLATAIMVFFAVAAAVTLLPALLALLGDRIDQGRVVRRHRPVKAVEQTRLVALRPPRLGPPLALPRRLPSSPSWPSPCRPCSCRRRSRQPGTLPAHTTHRQAYDLLTEGFGVGINAPLTVVADLSEPGVDADGLAGLVSDIAAVPGHRLYR